MQQPTQQPMPPPMMQRPMQQSHPPLPASGSTPAWAQGGGQAAMGVGQLPGLAGGSYDSGLPGLQSPEQGDDAPQKPMVDPMHDSMQNDPLLNAGKAVWSGMRGLFSAVKGGEAGKPGGDGSKDSQPNAFYYCQETKRWRERGKEGEDDISQYDPMTGKKLNPHSSAAPPPGSAGGDFGPPPIGGGGGPPLPGGPPPMGGGGGPPPMGGRPPAAGRGSLYVNPMSGAPHVAAASPGYGGATPTKGRPCRRQLGRLGCEFKGRPASLGCRRRCWRSAGIAVRGFARRGRGRRDASRDALRRWRRRHPHLFSIWGTWHETGHLRLRRKRRSLAHSRPDQ